MPIMFPTRALNACSFTDSATRQDILLHSARRAFLAMCVLPLLFACSPKAQSDTSGVVSAASAATVRPTGPLDVNITVQAGTPGNPVNPAVLGNNVQWVDYGDEILSRLDNALSPVMLEKAKALGPTMLRYPGGSQSDLYHWKDGIGPIEQRGEDQHFFSKARQKVMMGTQEFLELCEAVGAEPLITVNTATGTAEEAAGWVKLVNITGMKSRRTGKPLPKVKFWEIGNEPYLKDEGHPELWIQPEDFGAKAGKFIQAMRAIDPSIQVGIPLRSDKVGRFPATPYPGFNEKVLKSVGTDFNFVALHDAYLPLILDRDYTDDELADGLAAAAQVVRADFDQTRLQLKQFFPSKNIKLAVTEYNALFTWGGKPQDRYIATLGGALLVADLLREFAPTGDLQFANYWSLSGNWYFGAISKEGALRPSYHVLQFYRQALRGRFVPLNIQSPLVDTADTGFIPAATGVPLVAGIATTEGTRTRLILINKDARNTANITITLEGVPAMGKGSYTTLGGNQVFDSENAEVTLEKGSLTSSQQAWKFVMPAHSVTLVEFEAAVTKK